MKLTRRRMATIGVVAAVLALTITSFAPGVSLRKLVKKEVSKQISRAVGPQGAQGAPGQAGPGGPPGPTASNAASANPNPDTAISPASLSPVLSTTVTTTTTSRVIVDASIQVEPSFGTPRVACDIVIDGAHLGVPEQTSLSTPFVVISLSQGAVVSAGTHTVSIACQQPAAASGAVFAAGNITAIAAAA